MDNRDGDTPATTEEAARRVKEAASDATQRVREAAGSAVKDVKDAALHSAEDARAKAGDMGHTTASRLRDLAGQVESDLPWLSGAFSKSAHGLDSMTDSLTRGDMSQTINSLSDFARRQPAIFLGASVALGFALARVGKTALEGAHPQPNANANGTAPSADEVDKAYGPASGV